MRASPAKRSNTQFNRTCGKRIHRRSNAPRASCWPRLFRNASITGQPPTQPQNYFIKELVKIWWRSGMRTSILSRAFVSIHSQTPSFARSLIARPPSSSASSNRDVSFPIFKQCIILQSLDAEEMSGVVGNDFQPVGSLFHKKYHSESDFKNAFFNHVDPMIRKARVR